MTVGRAFRKLTRLIRRLERSDWTVATVEPGRDGSFQAGDQLVASLHCTRQNGMSDAEAGHPGLQQRRPAPDIIGELRELSSDIAVTPEQLWVEPDETTVLDLTIEIGLDDSVSDGRVPTNGDVPSDPPLHRDSERLRQLYEEHQTFDEMAAAVDRSVSEETIRRYMIDHGIHDPDVASNGHRRVSAEAQQISSADRSIVPAHVDEETFVSVVAESKTVREVATRLDVDRETAVTMLSELDLLEYVMGSIRNASDRSLSPADVRARLHEIQQPRP